MQIIYRVLECKNYYNILNVKQNASEGEIRKRYKQLALALHPDKNRAPNSEEAFKG